MTRKASKRIARASRPSLPAGYLEAKLLPWAWAEERLLESANYWVCTTRPDGRPHARPVWGVWLDDAVQFSTGGLIGRNLAHNAETTIHLESGDETVILEGRTTSTQEREALERYVEVYNPKYAWDFTPEQVGTLYVMRPERAFAWMCDGTGLDHGALFGGTATRFRFVDP